MVSEPSRITEPARNGGDPLPPELGRRRRNALSLLPTLCTLGNLLAGFAAIHYAAMDPTLRPLWGTWSPLTVAGMLVFLGIVLDAFDGALARLTRSESPVGAQLDSLADVVTCGVAPAFIVIRLVQTHLADVVNSKWVIGPEADLPYGKIIWGAAALFVSCAALRLARFNADADDSIHNTTPFFRGLPSPGAAGTLASLVILHQHLMIARFAEAPPLWLERTFSLVIPAVMLVCGLAMISPIRYVHFANRYLSGQASPQFIIRAVIVLTLAIWWFQEVLAVAFVTYALSGPVMALLRKR